MANSAAALRLQSDLKAISQSPPEGCVPESGPTEPLRAKFICCSSSHVACSVLSGAYTTQVQR